MKEHIANNSGHDPVRKKKYVRPELTQVELRAEEAVLGGCKNANAAGPRLGGVCTVPGDCMDAGS